MTRTLLVDDAPILRQLVRMVLEADGTFQVVAEAGDGVEAVDAAREHQPDLVLLDLAMPRMGGLEALPLIRAAAPGARVAVFTGFDDADVAENARDAGAARVLHKGLDPHALCRELQAMLADAPASPAPDGSEASGAHRSSRSRASNRPRLGLGNVPRLRIPAPVLVVLVVALLLALYGALVGFATPATPDAHYAGTFEEATFQEPALAATALLDGGYSVTVPSLAVRWSVDADGAVTMTGAASWPEAREAFGEWHRQRGHGEATFTDLRLATVDGDVLEGAGLTPA